MQGFVAKKQEDLANEKECNKSEKQNLKQFARFA